MSQSAEEAARSIEALASSSVYAERLIGVLALLYTRWRVLPKMGCCCGEENLELSIVLFGAAESSKIAYFVLSCSVQRQLVEVLACLGLFERCRDFFSGTFGY
jgi:hypothetical protein